MADSRVEIKHPILLVVEGRDEQVFFRALLDFMQRKDPVQILDFGGKDKLATQLKAYKLLPNFGTVKVLGIVRDADANSDAAWQSVQGALKSADMVVPQKPEHLAEGTPAVNVLITPGSGKIGKLETICLEAISSHPTIDCVDQFVTCVKKTYGDIDCEKARLQAFIAGVPKSSVRLLGDAAHAGYLNFESAAYAGMKAFLEALIEKQKV